MCARAASNIIYSHENNTKSIFQYFENCARLRAGSRLANIRQDKTNCARRTVAKREFCGKMQIENCFYEYFVCKNVRMWTRIGGGFQYSVFVSEWRTSIVSYSVPVAGRAYSAYIPKTKTTEHLLFSFSCFSEHVRVVRVKNSTNKTNRSGYVRHWTAASKFKHFHFAWTETHSHPTCINALQFVLLPLSFCDCDAMSDKHFHRTQNKFIQFAFISGNIVPIVWALKR